jgi:hypothetical protein
LDKFSLKTLAFSRLKKEQENAMKESFKKLNRKVYKVHTNKLKLAIHSLPN